MFLSFLFGFVNYYIFWYGLMGLGVLWCFRIYLEFDDDLNWCCDWISHREIVVDFVIELCFLFRGLMSYFQTELYQIFGRFFGVKILWISCCHKGLSIRFSNGFWFWCMPCGFLKGVPRNRGPLKDARWLPRIRPSGQGVRELSGNLIAILVSRHQHLMPQHGAYWNLINDHMFFHVATSKDHVVAPWSLDFGCDISSLFMLQHQLSILRHRTLCPEFG